MTSSHGLKPVVSSKEIDNMEALDGKPNCIRCGNKLTYCGEHHDDEEGWCSFYECKKCMPKVAGVLLRSWQRHRSWCRKKTCERCGGWQYRKMVKETLKRSIPPMPKGKGILEENL